MDVASELLWLDQLLDVAPQSASQRSAHVDAVRRLAQQAEGVRDALYELYCDAADRRMAHLVGSGGLLEIRVRATYRWCARIVGLLAAISSGLRDPSDVGPDWAAAKAGFREAAALYAPASEELRAAVSALRFDFASPVEPLRHLPRDVEQLFAAVDELHGSLQKRFG
jgi:hypothetical protein